MEMIDLSGAVRELLSADKVLILCHRNPDGDTLGSGTALVKALQRLGKKVRLMCDDKIVSKYDYLFEGIAVESFEPEYIVTVDVAERKLLGTNFNPLYGDRVDLAVDHHSNSKPFAKKTYCEGESASCCEILYLIIEAMGVEIDSGIASSLYTGCSTDTGCFKYSNVTPRTHNIAAKLIEKGAPHAKINERMFDTKSMNNIMFERMCLETLESHYDGRVAVISVTQEMLRNAGVDKSAIDAIKPITRQIEGVEIGITVKEEDDGAIGVSVRTGESADAAAICGNFGGGGHIRAAGCEFKNSTTEEVKAKVIGYIGTIL